jgi:hypothetical protein
MKGLRKDMIREVTLHMKSSADDWIRNEVASQVKEEDWVIGQRRFYHRGGLNFKEVACAIGCENGAIAIVAITANRQDFRKMWIRRWEDCKTPDNLDDAFKMNDKIMKEIGC